MNKPASLAVCLSAILLGGCLELVDDEADLELTEDTGEDTSALLAANQLAANQLAANQLAANQLAANTLAASSLQSQAMMATVGGRDLMSYIVGCAMPSGQNLTLQTSAGVQYTYPGKT
jgi:hypothetical protein